MFGRYFYHYHHRHHRSKTQKIVISIIISAIILLLIAVAIIFIGGNRLLDTALNPKGDGRDIEMSRETWSIRMPGIIDWYDSLSACGVFRDTVVKAEDGVPLYAVYAAAEDAGRPTAILVHGYTDNHICMMHLARMYRDSLNFNVLIPDNRRHGNSGGKFIQMGWLDRLDVKMWMNVANGIFGTAPMVSHGISMGAATVMMTSGEADLPSNVAAFIEDCGYSSVWEQFARELKKRYEMGPFPFLYSANVMCKLRCGWSFREASTIKPLSRCSLPMLFIHGDTDRFVPTAQIYKNYDAKIHGVRQMWLVPGARHAKSFECYPAEYTAKVREFLNNNI